MIEDNPTERNVRSKANGSEVRLRLLVQKQRAAIFSLALAVAVGLRLVGLLEVSYGQIAILVIVSNCSALILTYLYRQGVPRGLLDLCWLGLDVYFVSLAVYFTGGAESPWYPWYLPVISGAAFVIGQRAALATFLASLAAYLSTLHLSGDVVGAGRPLYEAVAVMICLYASSFFLLRGVRILQQKRQRIAEMERESRGKVVSLTRLTHELEATGEELRRVNQQLRETDRLKSQFLANVSHELRTPLNSILGFSEILESRFTEEAEDGRPRRYLRYIHESGQRLLKIIDDILDLSRMESGMLTLAPERLAVAGTVAGVCTLLRGPASRRSINLEIDVAEDLPLISADPTRLKQVLYHLLDNAVKFSDEGSTVTVRARLESQGGESELHLEVEDRGIGIAEEQREMIFRPFTQADGGLQREYEGAGLGLAIVRRSIELQKGALELESQVGVGCVFRVSLPVEVGRPARVGVGEASTSRGPSSFQASSIEPSEGGV
jgi:signal transduction histidine kinase